MSVKCHLMTTKSNTTTTTTKHTHIDSNYRQAGTWEKQTDKLSTHLPSSLQHTALCFYEVEVQEKKKITSPFQYQDYSKFLPSVLLLILFFGSLKIDSTKKKKGEREKACRQHAWARKLLMLQSLSSSGKTWFAAVQQRQCFLSLAERVILWNLVVDSWGACSSNKIRTQKKQRHKNHHKNPTLK